jgi:hypothetical protein
VKSPYTRCKPANWLTVSERLRRGYILAPDDLTRVVLRAWDSIFASRIGRHGHRIGKNFFPQPQIMGFFLHELVPIELEASYPSKWRRGAAASEPDAVCILDPSNSFEIKTSSSRGGIFGNRSYAQDGSGRKKKHGGFFLAVNFQGFEAAAPLRPEVTLIRFGWLDPADWIAQRAATGQQARLTKEAKAYKLLRIWSRE